MYPDRMLTVGKRKVKYIMGADERNGSKKTTGW